MSKRILRRRPVLYDKKSEAHFSAAGRKKKVRLGNKGKDQILFSI